MQYAYFNSAIAAPSPVIGWYDTDFAEYPNLPPATDLLELTAAQWSGRMTGQWAVSGGALVAYTPPAPVLTLAQQAQAALSAGLTITLSGTITLAETVFPTDITTQTKLNTMVNEINTSGTFFGQTTGLMKDAATPPAWHQFTAAQYKIVASAIGAYVAGLDLIIDGNPLGATSLPTNSVSLTV